MAMQMNSPESTDCVYRVSLKCLIRNREGGVLVVKETGSDWWDLPGGGMNHSESLKTAIAREMKEEVNMEGDFRYQILAVEEPALLRRSQLWQIRLIFEVVPHNLVFSSGEDADEIAFKDPAEFKDSLLAKEQKIYQYYQMAFER